jgi:hypothetical protein
MPLMEFLFKFSMGDSSICISLFPFLIELNKPQRMPFVILYATLWNKPIPILLFIR